MKKYNDGDGLVELEPKDDAATEILGNSCKIPSEKDFCELINNTYAEWVENYKGSQINGIVFFKVTDDKHKGVFNEGFYYNINSDDHIFIPACGEFFNGRHIEKNSAALVLTSTLDSTDQNIVAKLITNKYDLDCSFDNYGYRYSGNCIRPIQIK